MLKLALVAIAFSWLASSELPAPADPLDAVRQLYSEDAADSRYQFYSKRLSVLLEEDDALAKSAGTGNLDFDFLVNGHETELLDLWFETLSQTNEGAAVGVTFQSEGEFNELHFDLVFEDGGWRIDDVQSIPGDGWILSAILRGQQNAALR
jgi:hypothetical protein